VSTPLPRFPLTRLMLGNATLLSGIYLAFGLAVELVRRYANTRWAERLSFALDALPARALEVAQLMRPLSYWYQSGALSEFWLRVVFGLTTVAIIFAMAVVVGLSLWLVRAWAERASRARPGRNAGL
jgi:hypothetical protein